MRRSTTKFRHSSPPINRSPPSPRIIKCSKTSSQRSDGGRKKGGERQIFLEFIDYCVGYKYFLCREEIAPLKVVRIIESETRKEAATRRNEKRHRKHLPECDCIGCYERNIFDFRAQSVLGNTQFDRFRLVKVNFHGRCTRIQRKQRRIRNKVKNLKYYDSFSS
jgi:hypothetical protein